MKIIVKEISKDIYTKSANSFEFSSFLNAVEMENISDLRNHPSLYVGFYNAKKLEGVCRFIITPVGNKKIFYAVRGPLIDYTNDELVKAVTLSLRCYLKERGGFELKIDPAIIYQERDIDGNIVENGINNNKIVDLLKSIGFRHQGFNIEYDHTRQNRWEYGLNLKNKTIDEVLKNVKQNHRNIINKTKNFGISVEELKYEELSVYKDITLDTANRRGFSDLNLEYYQTIYNSFKDSSKFKFLVAYLYPKNYIKILEEQLKHNNDLYDRKVSSSCSKGELNELKITIDSLKKRLDFANTLEGEKIPLSGALFIIHNGTCYYMSSGSYKEYMNFYAQYAIQWFMINYCVNNNIKKYNFMGITGNFSKDNPDYGVYEFKKGFGGYVMEYIGEFHLPLSPYYYIVDIKNKIKKLIKKILKK